MELFFRYFLEAERVKNLLSRALWAIYDGYDGSPLASRIASLYISAAVNAAAGQLMELEEEFLAELNYENEKKRCRKKP
jgi:hypothetical protein